MHSRPTFTLLLLLASLPAWSASVPTLAERGMVVSQDAIASEAGVSVLRRGGSAVDAAIATAFTLAVVHPAAGNLGGGGFLVHLSAHGNAETYDFRETAPATATPTMWLVDGAYDAERHHHSHLAVGVPGTVAGLHLAWREHGRLPWRDLVQPAIALARDGFQVSHSLALSLRSALPRMRPYPASMAQFSKDGAPYAAGDLLVQGDLARTLEEIAEQGPDGFYKGRVAALLAKDMAENGGILTADDLAAYAARKRTPIHGTYRGYDVYAMPPPSSGGVCLVQMLNVLEGYDLAADGFGAAANLHRYAEAMRGAFLDRARHLGDPDHVAGMPVARLVSKDYAAALRARIDPARASESRITDVTLQEGGGDTTHLSVVDAERNAVSLTYTLEQSYGSAIVAPGTGFLLNNEMGDFNAAPGLSTETGLIGTEANLAAPGKRMLSSMTPTILAKDGKFFMATGSPGGRTIINTVFQTIVNVVDFGMNAQEAVDAGRIHHQWLPDKLLYERHLISPDTIAMLEGMGHRTESQARQGAAQVIVAKERNGLLEGGSDTRAHDGAAKGY